MTLKERIEADFRTAFKSGDKQRKMTLSMLKTAITADEKAEGNNGKELSESHVLEIVKKYAKSLNQTIDMIKDNTNAVKLSAQAELLVVADYLPNQLSEDAINQEIRGLIGTLDLSNKNKAVGSIMNHFKANFNGQYTPTLLKTIVDKSLSAI